MYFVQHIDSVIQLGVGIAFTWMGFHRSVKLGSRTTKIFRVCGPALIVIGGLLFLKPTATANWERRFTTDKIASAEFPGAVEAKESIDTLGAVTVKRTSFNCNVPGRDISLFLSSSPLPENTRSLTDAQRIDGTVAYFTSQGAKIVQNEKDPGTPIYRLTLRQDDQRTTTQMALAYVDETVYRVVASWIDGQEDRQLTNRFVNSFQVSTAPPH